MSLISKIVEIKWNPCNKAWYVSKGYQYTKMGDIISVQVEDLTNGSDVAIIVQCDECGKTYSTTWNSYLRYKKSDNKIYCQPCAAKLYGGETARKSALKNGKSFGEVLLDTFGSDAIEKYWSNKNDYTPFDVGYGSNMKSWLICQSCGNEKEVRLADFFRYGIGCEKCSDGISYPEKFVESVLNQLNETHISQLSHTTFDWCDKYRYDKYLLDKNIIIEIHGEQHYVFRKTIRSHSLKEEQKNDDNKKQLAYSNGFNENNYIVIDARHSTIEHIKQSVMNSKLPQLLNFKEEDIDWVKCNEESLTSYVKIACDYWKTNIYSINDISKIMGLENVTIIRYLKSGTISGWCFYDSEIEKNKNYKKKSKMVICLELDKIYDSIRKASIETGIHKTCISFCCRGHRHHQTAGGYHWMYYEDYLKELVNNSSFLLQQN